MLMRLHKILTTIAVLAATLIPVYGQSKKDLLRQNELLVRKVESLEEELEALKKEEKKNEGIRKEMIEIYTENEDKLAAGMSGESYSPEATDSLLSIWYLHRQARSSEEGAAVDMDSVHFTSNVPDQVMIDRLEKMNAFFTLPYNETVKNYMILYSERMPRKMSHILGLCSYYMPIFEETFVRYGLPVELKYVAIIESALNPLAVSRAGATGMWQFMYNTAKSYGLEIDSYVDERKDPFASVDAAARYLKDAYAIFGDWSLAISSYNCGSGNVNKAIKRSGSRDFWSIYPYLPKETRGYVPAMVGAMYAVNYAKEYGLEPSPVVMPAYTDTFHIHKNLHFRQIEELIGLPVGDLRDLNPQYYRDIVPGSQGDYILRLPYNYSAAFIDVQDTVYNHRAKEIFSGVDVDRYGNSGEGPSVSHGTATGTTWVYYKVKNGDSLGKIASKYHTSVNQLKSWNGLKSTTIRVGQSLKVGKKATYSTTSSSSSGKSSSSGSGKSSSSSSSSSSGGYTTYTVKSGDTLYKIASNYPGVTAADIMKYNNISENIHPGDKLKIPKK